MRRSTIYFLVFGLAVIVMTALASAGLVVSAQNANKSTTMANTSKPKPKPRKKPAPAKPPCDNTKQEQTDLSGTYTGKLKHGNEKPVDATLTINGNSFTATMGTEKRSGRITAVTTCGYTAVTIMHEGETHAMSLRARKVGNNLTLESVPGEPQKVMFTTGGMMKPKPRKHRAKAKAATGTPTPPAKPKQ